MEFFVFAVIVAVIWWLVKSKKAAGSSTKAHAALNRTQAKAALTVAPEIKVTITTSTGSGKRPRKNVERQDLGPLSPAGFNAWLLNPKATFPLTLIGANEDLARQVWSLFKKEDDWWQKVPELALLVAQHNLSFKEVKAFIAEQKPKFEAAVAHHIKASPEWGSASERDRQDLRAEYCERALDGLGISIGDADPEILLLAEPADFTSDDEVLRSFGGDSSLYSFYLTQLGRSSSAETVKVDDWGRKSWEQLVERGRALRGKDIPVSLLLDGLRLKDINELLQGTIEKPFGRKAKALEAAQALPDLQARLSERISFRELFQVLPPAGVDIQALRSSFGHAQVVATVALQTYNTAAMSHEVVARRNDDDEFYDGWEVVNWADPVPACAQRFCKKYPRLPAKLPPFHLGCNCELERTCHD